MNIIETENLSKVYRRFQKREGLKGSIQNLWKREYVEKTAVNNMTLSVQEGEFLGLIGPNGAGKTTLIKMLTGIIAPTSGLIQVMGFYPNDLKNEFKKQYAVVMGQKSQLFMELTANDTLRLFKEIYEMSEADYQSTRDYFVELFDVKELMDVQVRTLSLGERMKMELMTALLHHPRILFLDEPTIGLDAVASRQIRGFLKQISEEKGTTVLLTSHYMEDIRSLCRRSVVINHGCKLYDGDTERLFEKYQKNKRVTVSFRHPVEDWEVGKGAMILKSTPRRKIFSIPKDKTDELLHELTAYELSDITIEEDEIGMVVERIYREGGKADETV